MARQTKSFPIKILNFFYCISDPLSSFSFKTKNVFLFGSTAPEKKTMFVAEKNEILKLEILTRGQVQEGEGVGGNGQLFFAVLSDAQMKYYI